MGEGNPTLSIDPSLINNPFLSSQADRSLRITCYGSSSSKTPEAYLVEARSLGYILAKRGHICVNGAGSFGCMAAMNDGAMAGNGHIVGVMHEMFIVDNGYAVGGKSIERDGGTHEAFLSTNSNDDDRQSSSSSSTDIPVKERTRPIREIQVAGGKDLQERKKLLVQNADGLIVLPGGPGTWDELWEMSCARHLGLIDLPIVCVNVNGYYEPFREMLQRAHKDELTKLPPERIVHFTDTAEEAVRWIENEKTMMATTTTPTSSTRTEILEKKRNLALTVNRSSFMSSEKMGIWERLSHASSFAIEESSPGWSYVAVTFIVGIGCGVVGTYAYVQRR